MGNPTWDRFRWTVTGSDGASFIIETTNGSTSALRLLIAAGAKGLHPIDTGGGRWAFLIDTLRSLGVAVDDLPPDANGRRGYVLACAPVMGERKTGCAK